MVKLGYSHLVESVYEVIVDQVRATNIPPSRREIADRCGISPLRATSVLKELDDQGRIRLHPGMARGIELNRELKLDGSPKWNEKPAKSSKAPSKPKGRPANAIGMGPDEVPEGIGVFPAKH